MNRYTIHCTEQQTRKALELGAPINKVCLALTDNWRDETPTAEQMIGWLNEQGVQITTHVDVFGEWKTYLYKTSSVGIIAESEWSKSRKETIIVAIDEALKYLENLKQ